MSGIVNGRLFPTSVLARVVQLRLGRKLLSLQAAGHVAAVPQQLELPATELTLLVDGLANGLSAFLRALGIFFRMTRTPKTETESSNDRGTS